MHIEHHANGHFSDPKFFADPAFFRMADVIRITALSRATLYRRIAGGKFPPPVRLGGRACGWPRAALQSWIDDPEGYVAQAEPAGRIDRKDKAAQQLRSTAMTKTAHRRSRLCSG